MFLISHYLHNSTVSNEAMIACLDKKLSVPLTWTRQITDILVLLECTRIRWIINHLAVSLTLHELTRDYWSPPASIPKMTFNKWCLYILIRSKKPKKESSLFSYNDAQIKREGGWPSQWPLLWSHAVVKGSEWGCACGPAENEQMSLKRSPLKWQQTVQKDVPSPTVSTDGPSTCKLSTAAATNATL